MGLTSYGSLYCPCCSSGTLPRRARQPTGNSCLYSRRTWPPTMSIQRLQSEYQTKKPMTGVVWEPACAFPFRLSPIWPILRRHLDTVQLFTTEYVLWELLGTGCRLCPWPGQEQHLCQRCQSARRSGLEGWGCFPDSFSGVRMLTLQRYVEALILITLSSTRDSSRSTFRTIVAETLDALGPRLRCPRPDLTPERRRFSGELI